MNDEKIVYSEAAAEAAKQTEYYGRMNDPVSCALLRGPCGDEMEIYLVIKDRIIEEIKVYTDACEATLLCGYAVARMAQGKSVEEVLSIAPARVLDSVLGLPEDHRHCSILAVSTLYRAIAEYLLMR